MLAMKTIKEVLTRSNSQLLWFITFFAFLVVAGCGNKNNAIETLNKKNILITADSLTAYSSQGDLATVKLLLDAGVDVNAKNSDGSNALVAASWAGKQEVVAHLLDVKADANLVASGQLAALSAAVGQKHESVALLLLERGAKPNVTDPVGSTPLMEAAWQGNLNIVKNLMAKGADVNRKRDKDGFTALRAAVANNKPDIVQALKNAGAIE